MCEYTPVQWLQETVRKCVNFLSKKDTDIDDNKLKNVYKKFTYEEKQFVHKLLREQFETNDAIYILSYLTGVLKIKDFWEDVVWHVSRGTFDGFTGSMLEIQLVTSEVVPNSQIRNIHRKNVECLSKEIGVDFPYIPVGKRNHKRIVIITEQLLGIRHAPTAMTLETAYVLERKLGYEVMLLTCTSNKKLPFWLWLFSISYNGREKGHDIISYRDATLDIWHYPMRTCEIKDYREMLSQIYQWNPLFVLNMGVNNPIADLPHKFTSIAVRTMTTRPSVSCGDILIRNMRGTDEHEWEVEKELRPYQKQVFLLEKFPVVFEETGKDYTRRELGLPEDKFLVAIVGNRLQKEIDETFLAVMCRLLEENSEIDFVIIGQISKIGEERWDEDMKKRIHYIGYCKDLHGVYKVLDLYLNPKRNGGGWSSAIALRTGLPVVTLPECDVAYNVGEEYVISDYEEMIATTVRYATDEQFYKEKRRQALKRADEKGEDKAVEYVTQLVTKIQEAMEE